MSHIERYALDKNNENSAMPLTVDIETWFKVTANPFTQRHHVDKVSPRLRLGERRYAPGK